MATLPLGTGTTSTFEVSPFADIESAAANTGKDSIVVAFTAIFRGGAAAGLVAVRAARARMHNKNTGIVLNEFMRVPFFCQGYSTEKASNRFPPEAPLVIAYPELTKTIPPVITGPDTEIAPP